MTISAQVIETIVGWIDDNLHQPLRIDDMLATPVTQNGICNDCFYNIKGRVWGAIFVSVSCGWRRATCAIPTSGFTISA
nr:transcriptional activator RamA [Raoultella sp. NCTC 9187]